jgi:hypothetical protein
VTGDLVRWYGSGWECSREGAALLPEPSIGEGASQGGCRPGQTCPEGYVPRITFGDPPTQTWTSFGGGGVRTSFRTDSEGRILGPATASVDEFALTRLRSRDPRGPEIAALRMGWSLGRPDVRSIEVSPLVVPAIAAPSADPGWKAVAPGSAQRLWITVEPHPNDEAALFTWWRRYAEGNASPEDLVIDGVDASGGRVLLSYAFRECVPAAWRHGQHPSLVMQCRWDRFEERPEPGDPSDPDPFVVWLNAVLAGNAGVRDVIVEQVGSDTGTVVRRLTYRGSFISRYLFPSYRDGELSPQPAQDVVFFRAQRLEAETF